MIFRIDGSSGVPTYLQLVQQVKHAVRQGVLQPEDRLPTIKDVVGSLAINPNTVAKAYRELEREGIVVGRQGTGTFVRGDLEVPARDRMRRLERDLARWVSRARGEGLDGEAMVSMLRAVAEEGAGGAEVVA